MQPFRLPVYIEPYVVLPSNGAQSPDRALVPYGRGQESSEDERKYREPGRQKKSMPRSKEKSGRSRSRSPPPPFLLGRCVRQIVLHAWKLAVWSTVTVASGDYYFVETETGKTSWDPPTAPFPAIAAPATSLPQSQNDRCAGKDPSGKNCSYLTVAGLDFCVHCKLKSNTK